MHGRFFGAAMGLVVALVAGSSAHAAPEPYVDSSVHYDDVIVTDVMNCSAGTIQFTRGNACHERGFFAHRFDPKEYWRAQDASWGIGGIVEVGPVLRARSQ